MSEEEKIAELPVEQEDELAKEFTCKGCGDSFDTVQKLATHSRYCPEAKALREAVQEPTEEEREKEEEESPYRGEGEDEPNEILRHILSAFPGVNKAVVTEVMSWAELWGSIPPYYLPYLLGQMKGVSQGTANLISQKYSLAMQKKQQMQRSYGPQVPMGMGTGGGPPGGGMFPPPPMGFQQPSMGMDPYQGFGQPPAYGYGYGRQDPRYMRPAPGGVTKADLADAMKKMGEKSEMQRLQDTVVDLTRTMGTLKNDIIKEVGDSRTQYREIRVPIDAAGNPCPPSEAKSVRYERVPMAVQGGGGTQSSEILNRLDLMDKKITDQTLGKIQADLEELKKGPPTGTRSREMEKLEAQLEKNEEMIGQLSGQIEENKYNALLEELEKIRGQVGRAGAGDWDSDEMKFVSTALNRLADVVESKKPMEVLKEALLPQGPFNVLPPDMQRPLESTPSTLVERLRQDGLVSTLTRRRG